MVEQRDCKITVHFCRTARGSFPTIIVIGFVMLIDADRNGGFSGLTERTHSESTEKVFNTRPFTSLQTKSVCDPFTPGVNYEEMCFCSNFSVCGQNPMVLPFKQNLSGSTST